MVLIDGVCLAAPFTGTRLALQLAKFRFFVRMTSENVRLVERKKALSAVKSVLAPRQLQVRLASPTLKWSVFKYRLWSISKASKTKLRINTKFELYITTRRALPRDLRSLLILNFRSHEFEIMVKRTTPSAVPGGSSGKKAKQQSLKDSFMHAATAPVHLPVNVSNTDVPVLGQGYTQDLEGAFENYCQKWGEKCYKESIKSVHSGAVREEVDLDAFGMHLVATFKSAVQVAGAQGVGVPHHLIEAMALVVRNDAVHHSSHVSRAAQGALMAYLSTHPYVKLAHYSSAHSSNSEGMPYVLVTRNNVWLPMEE